MKDRHEDQRMDIHKDYEEAEKNVAAAVSESPLSAYYRKYGRRNRLTSEQMNVLVDMAKAGDDEALNRAWLSNIGLVFKFSDLFFKKHGITNEEKKKDLIQAGLLGLRHAVLKYETDKDVMFSTYARYWIDGYLGRASGELSEDDEFLSLSDPISFDGRRTIQDIIKNDEDESTDTTGNYEAKEMTKILLRSLTDREAFVIVHRYGLFGEKFMTFEELASELGVTRARVKQIQEKAIRKLRMRPERLGISRRVENL